MVVPLGRDLLDYSPSHGEDDLHAEFSYGDIGSDLRGIVTDYEFCIRTVSRKIDLYSEPIHVKR